MAGGTKKTALLAAASAVVGPGISSVAASRAVPVAPSFGLRSTYSTPTAQTMVSSLPRGGSQGGGKDDTAQKKKHKKSKKRRSKKKDSSHNTRDSVPTQQSPTDDDVQHESNEERPTKPKPSATPQKPKRPNPVIREVLASEDYYDILGVPASADATAIKKAYRRRCVQTHPDKTDGDRRAFDKVSEAYDVLSDEEKRQVYDRFGKDGVNQQPGGGFGGGSPEDLFRAFFGGGPSQFQQQRPTRNRTVRYQLEVTLEDLYKGMTRSVLVAPPRNNPFVEPEQHQSKRVQVHIPRGAQNGQNIVMSGEMDWDHDSAPGDLVFGLQARPHKTFVRRGYDLAVTVDLRVSEAASGNYTRAIRHLDGRELVIGTSIEDDDASVTPRSSVLRPGQVHVIRGEGMPKDETGTAFGDLYVMYKVKQPEPKAQLTSEERTELKRLLDKLEGVSIGEASKTEPSVVLKDASLRDFGVASGQPPPLGDHGDDNASPGFQPFGPGGRSSSFYFSSSGSPFFGMGPGFDGPGAEDDENVQCRQM